MERGFDGNPAWCFCCFFSRHPRSSRFAFICIVTFSLLISLSVNFLTPAGWRKWDRRSTHQRTQVGRRKWILMRSLNTGSHPHSWGATCTHSHAHQDPAGVRIPQQSLLLAFQLLLRVPLLIHQRRAPLAACRRVYEALRVAPSCILINSAHHVREPGRVRAAVLLSFLKFAARGVAALLKLPLLSLQPPNL